MSVVAAPPLPDPDEVLEVLRMRERMLLAGLERLRGQIVVARDTSLRRKRRTETTLVVPMKRRRLQKKKRKCPVCLGKMAKNCAVTTECKHLFHVGCLDRWASTRYSNPTCPTCRKQLFKPS
jgi:hypothetical protein